MEYDAVKENEFTFEMGEVCAEDFDNKSLWMLKLSYDVSYVYSIRNKFGTIVVHKIVLFDVES